MDVSSGRMPPPPGRLLPRRAPPRLPASRAQEGGGGLPLILLRLGVLLLAQGGSVVGLSVAVGGGAGAGGIRRDRPRAGGAVLPPMGMQQRAPRAPRADVDPEQRREARRSSISDSGRSADAPRAWRGQVQSPSTSGLRRSLQEANGESQGSPPVDPEIQGQVDALMQVWSERYGLAESQPPAEVVPTGEAWAWAPHLQECVALSQHQEEEEYGTEPGRFPAWACPLSSQTASQSGPAASFCEHPEPPWIYGSNAENLPRTREVQRDLWARQNPRDCRAPQLKFLVVEWKGLHLNGLGSQVHTFAAAFSMAVGSDRIMVPLLDSFEAADHPGCVGKDRLASWKCYYADIVAPECASRAMELLHSQPVVTFAKWDQKAWSQDSLPVVFMPRNYTFRKLECVVPTEIWGQPWNHGHTFSLRGEVYHHPHHMVRKCAWWYSQSIRFMMRRSSPYLCHITNKVRHDSYGRLVAERIVGSRRELVSIEKGPKSKLLEPGEAARLAQSSGRKDAMPLDRTAAWRFRAEPLLPRPIVSLHVRQGDKWREMRMFSFASYMWLAEKLRSLDPTLQNVWLSTEMQTVVDRTAEFPDWTFYFTKIKRQRPFAPMRGYMASLGPEMIVGMSFANLVISSQCDYFIGVLGSNWNRLINELRLTGGRLKSTYLALNHDEF